MEKVVLALIKYIMKLFGAKTEDDYIPNNKPPLIHSPAKPRINLEIGESLPWKGIVWHHSESPDRPSINDWKGIVLYHTSYRIDGDIVTKEEFERRKALGQGKKFLTPWRDVGYHGGVERVGDKIVFHWGRPLTMTGSHSAVEGVSSGYNKTHLGLCLIGNYDVVAPDEEVFRFCLSITRSFMDRFDISSSEVLGHREVFDALGIPRQKMCPGKYFDLDKFRTSL